MCTWKEADIVRNPKYHNRSRDAEDVIILKEQAMNFDSPTKESRFSHRLKLKFLQIKLASILKEGSKNDKIA